MAIISKVGRKTAKTRVLITLMYLALIAGSVTMIYPFGIMLTGSISNRYDYERFRFLPRYFTDRGELFMKFLFEKHPDSYFAVFAAQYELRPPAISWRAISETDDFFEREIQPIFAALEQDGPRLQRRVADFHDFKGQLTADRFVLNFMPSVVDRYPKWLRRHYVELVRREDPQAGAAEAIELLGRIWDQAPATFDVIIAPNESNYYLPKLFPGGTDKAADWFAFKSACPVEWRKVVPARDYWHRFLINRYGSVVELNQAWGANYDEVHQIPFPADLLPALCRTGKEPVIRPRNLPRRMTTLSNEAARHHRRAFAGMVRERMGLEQFNHRAGMSDGGWDDVALPTAPPAHAHQFALWDEYLTAHVRPDECLAWNLRVVRDDLRLFLQKRFPRRFVRLSDATGCNHRSAFVSMIRELEGSVEAFNRQASANHARFENIPFPTSPPSNLYLFTLWGDYLARHVDPSEMLIWDPEQAYRAFLIDRYGSLEAINNAHGTHYRVLDDLLPPYREADVVEFESREREWMWRFATQNFRRVLEFISLKGYALWNTLVLVTLSIVASLTVNPMAAYALSRYSLKSAHRILIFMLATMAFPVEVAMIPNFLMLRDLGLLNTYAALVLPGLANGYWIFLLKGFFDSLPRELYEAAQIDGASELKMFRVITLPLSQPILAVIALGAFTSAYTSFMWAFVVCQRKDMWTLMVWLFQFQQQHANVEPYLVMASLVIVSAPTLLVFLFCQKIILRGIIIPQMK